MEMPPDTLEAVGVNELFVAVTVDTSFTTEQAVVGRIDEIHILIVVRTTPIVGYLSPSQICDTCSLLRARKLGMEIPPDSLEDFLTKAKGCLFLGVHQRLPCLSRFAHLAQFVGKFVFFKNSRPIPGESSVSPTPSLQSSLNRPTGEPVPVNPHCLFHVQNIKNATIQN
jgi:hypothetical protein